MATRKIGLQDVEETGSPRRLRLLAPLRYLKIHAPEKGRYDFLIPVVVGLVVWVIYNMLDPKPSLFGPSGLLTSAQNFLMMAVPFLIGALASVAMGSPGGHLDRRTIGAGVVLDGKSLSLRQFVCHLLGYLSFLGLVIFLIVSISAFVEPTAVRMLLGAEYWAHILGQVYTMLMFVLLSAFAITVFWALYFLTDTVNQHD